MIEKAVVETKEAVEAMALLVKECTEDPQLRNLFCEVTLAIASAAFRAGLEKGYLKGRAEGV